MIIVDVPVMDVKRDLSVFKDLAEKGGVYAFYKDETPLYVGKCKNLKTRIYEHVIGMTNTSSFFGSFEYVKFFYEDCPMNRDIYETYLINTLKPLFNKNKTFTYIPKFKGVSVKVKKPTRWERPIKKDRCQHIKNNGEQCKNYVHENGYCGIHKNSLAIG